MVISPLLEASDNMLDLNKVKEFLNKWEKELRANNFDAILRNLSSYDYNFLRELCEECDINLLEHLTYIPEDFFAGDLKLKDITIPTNIKEIQSRAFQGCKNLKTVQIEGSINKIGRQAFEGCENLESINLPEGLQILEARTFAGCKNLEYLFLPDSLQQVKEDVFDGMPDSAVIELRKGIVRQTDPNHARPKALSMRGTSGEFISKHYRWKE